MSRPHKTMLKTLLPALAAATGLAACSGPEDVRSTIPDGDWRTINRDLAATRFSPLADINGNNVARLTESWTYQLGGNSTAVPIVVAGVMYLPSRERVVAIDAATGSEIWAYELDLPVSATGGNGPTASTRGVSYWPGDAEHDPRIVFMARTYMIALDAATGRPIGSFGDGGHIDVGVPYGGTPTIHEEVAIIGAASGEVPQGPAGNPRAFNVITGDKMWEF